jgi:hypothetical protein
VTGTSWPELLPVGHRPGFSSILALPFPTFSSPTPAVCAGHGGLLGICDQRLWPDPASSHIDGDSEKWAGARDKEGREEGREGGRLALCPPTPPQGILVHRDSGACLQNQLGLAACPEGSCL